MQDGGLEYVEEYWKDLEGTYWQNDELVLSVAMDCGLDIGKVDSSLFADKKIVEKKLHFTFIKGKGQEIVGQRSGISTARLFRVVCGFGARGCQF